MSQEGAVAHIVIVGGGTSGWMSASYLRRSFPEAEVTVIEAPAVPRIGVGEATIPNLDRAFWQHLGIPEHEWMSRVRATCKMGIKFANWSSPESVDPDDFYWHLFGVVPTQDDIPLPHYWNQRRLRGETDDRYHAACIRESHVAERKLSPVDLDGNRWSHYAWHFDANVMVEYLKELSLGWGVQLIPELVVDGRLGPDGSIDCVVTESGREIHGDLFIDCTGFRSNLIGGLLDEPFIDASDALLCNAAVATQLPQPDGSPQVEAFTTATALDNGWSWRIPLLGRIGTGYVYSDRHCSEDDAIAEFSAHLGVDGSEQDWNRIKFRVGRRERAWVGNCVAVGLASNFLEPLESTALFLTYGSLYQLVRFLPDGDLTQADRDGFNAEVAYSYDDCKDFVQMHYVCSPRRDTAFWRDSQALAVSDTLAAKLANYRNGRVINGTTSTPDEYYGDFDYEFRNFWTEGSYYAVLTGMGVFPERENPALESTDQRRVDELFSSVRAEAEQAISTLPSHREFLEQLYFENGELIIDLSESRVNRR